MTKPDTDKQRDDKDLEPGTMTFTEHLEELRRRIIVCLIAVTATMFVFLLAKDPVMGLINKPYEDCWRMRAEEWKADVFDKLERDKIPNGFQDEYDLIKGHWAEIMNGQTVNGVDPQESLKQFGFRLPRALISITPLQDIVVFMLAAALFGFLVSSPIVLHQMWAFIGAGLYKREKRAVMRMLPASLGLFGSGALFGYFFMVPYALLFLTRLSTAEPTLTVRDYFQFLFLLTAALGFVFQLPLIMVALVRVGITTPAFYVKYWRHSVLGMVIMGAVLTPPDPFTQIMMATPMIALYGVGLALSRVVYRKHHAAATVLNKAVEEAR